VCTGSEPTANLQDPQRSSGCERSIVLVVGLVSYFSLVLGELVPKSLALRHSERYALLIAPALNGLAVAARPLVWLLLVRVLPPTPAASPGPAGAHAEP